MNIDVRLRRGRAAIAAALVLAFALAACSTAAPSLEPTTVAATASPLPIATVAPTPVVTPIPTPSVTFRPLTAADLGDGWTIIATETNIDGIGRTAILGPIKVGTSFAMICVGAGTARVSFAAAGGWLTPPPEGANEFFSTTYTCPTLVQASLTNQFDYGGISLNPDVAPSDGITYQLIAGTQP